jgi:uncharacterized lipoprotein YmbA
MKKNFLPAIASGRSLSRFPAARVVAAAGWFLLSAIWLSSGGCSLPEAKTDTARYYVLPSSAEASSAESSAPRVGFFPVRFPDYLKSRSIAVREGTSEIHYFDEERWAEPLDVGVARVLTERLSATAQVVRYPFSLELTRDYDVRVRVMTCEGTTDGLAVFSATYEIYTSGANGSLVAQSTFAAKPDG